MPAVLPSNLLQPLDNEQINYNNRNLNNSNLKVGVVVEVHDIDSEKNMSKLFPEYDVITNEQNGVNGQSFVEYTNCIAIDSLGGVADFFEYKRRASDSESFRSSYEFDKQNGSIVLLLCIDGFSDKAIIIGGISNVSRATTLTTENGLHMEGEYNGVNWKIDKDGALTVTFKSHTNNDGVPQDKDAGGTTLTMDKEGSIDLDTNLKEQDVTKIKLDKKNKNIIGVAGNDVQLTAEKNIKMKSKTKFEAETEGAILIQAEGAAKVSSNSVLNLEGESAVNMKGTNISITGDSGVKIKGSKCTIDAPKVFLGQGGAGEPAVIGTTEFVGIGNLGAIVKCFAVGPFSKSVFIAS